MTDRDIKAMHIASGLLGGIPITEDDLESNEEAWKCAQAIARISYMVADALELESVNPRRLDYEHK